MKKHYLLILALIFILLAAATRFIDLPFNFNPILSIALLGAFALPNSSMKFGIPLAAMFVSDILLNNTVYKEWFPNQDFVLVADHMIWTYASIALIVILGGKLLTKINPPRVLTSAILAAIIFFLITNFGSWLSISTYPKNIAGLTECYGAAIPFFRATLVSNILFTCFFVGAYEFCRRFIESQVITA